MFLKEIFLRDAETYYNVRTGKKTHWAARLLSKIMVGIIAAVFFKFQDNAYSSLMSIYSILIGFAFTAQFFLVDKKYEPDPTSGYIEDQILLDKLNILSRELYSNISYLSAACVVALLIAFVASLETPSTLANILMQHGLLESFSKLGVFLTSITFYEVISAFWRTSVRTQYLFEKVRGI